MNVPGVIFVASFFAQLSRISLIGGAIVWWTYGRMIAEPERAVRSQLTSLQKSIESAERFTADGRLLYSRAARMDKWPVIIGNTIRLDIENRRDEIEVTKLIGASNAFVRRPFLWTGFWYGLLGGLMALLLVYVGLALLTVAIFGKMHREEGHLHEKFTDYSDYVKRTHRLLPKIY